MILFRIKDTKRHPSRTSTNTEIVDSILLCRIVSLWQLSSPSKIHE